MRSCGWPVVLSEYRPSITVSSTSISHHDIPHYGTGLGRGDQLPGELQGRGVQNIVVKALASEVQLAMVW